MEDIIIGIISLMVYTCIIGIFLLILGITINILSFIIINYEIFIPIIIICTLIKL
jgi:hypothetical protein